MQPLKEIELPPPPTAGTNKLLTPAVEIVTETAVRLEPVTVCEKRTFVDVANMVFQLPPSARNVKPETLRGK